MPLACAAASPEATCRARSSAFESGTRSASIRARSVSPSRSSVVAHSALERLLKKCFAKNPEDRWQSAADLSDELTWINEERLRSTVPSGLRRRQRVDDVGL